MDLNRGKSIHNYRPPARREIDLTEMELATNQPEVFAARLHAKLEAYIIEQVTLKY